MRNDLVYLRYEMVGSGNRYLRGLVDGSVDLGGVVSSCIRIGWMSEAVNASYDFKQIWIGRASIRHTFATS